MDRSNVLVQPDMVDYNTHARNAKNLPLEHILHLGSRGITVQAHDIVLNQYPDIPRPFELAGRPQLFDTVIDRVQEIIFGHEETLYINHAGHAAQSFLEFLALDRQLDLTTQSQDNTLGLNFFNFYMDRMCAPFCTAHRHRLISHFLSILQ